MNKSIKAVGLVSALVLINVLAGCGGGGGGSSSGGSSAGNTTVSGTVINSTTQQPLAGIVVSVVGTSLTATTDSSGDFTIDNVPGGNQNFTFTSSGTSIGTDNGVNVTGDTQSLGNVVVNDSQSPPPPPSSGL
jgi:hypothetical protein